ncbi:MAG: hypothetical protein QM687_13740 [Ferruginibacter sp.]
MCYKRICPVAVVSLFILQSTDTNAQTYKYELGVNLGAYVYQGDLSPQKLGSFKTIRPGLGLALESRSAMFFR